MGIVKKILRQLSGLHFTQEYLCLAKEQFSSKLYAYLIVNKTVVKDITADHVFAGYCPLIFALSAFDDKSDIITVCFTPRAYPLHTVLSKDDYVAQLKFQKINVPDGDIADLSYYVGLGGWHYFLSLFQQKVIGLDNQLYHKKEANVFLNNNLYKQVQIAYSLPRTISLITVMQHDLYNLFPTDLHGPVNKHYYIISLRHSGKACSQVEAVKRIVLTNIAAEQYKQVYELGKNHMQPMKRKDQFPFSEMTSTYFQYPLPIKAVEYKELELQSSFVYGIHKLLLFKIINQQKFADYPSTLAHIHNSYATWRYKQHIESNYLMR